MKGLKISVHPLFIILGIYFAVTGRVFSFLAYSFSCIVHELGHSIVAEKSGYKLKKLTLMPYGAVIKGDIKGINLKDEIKVVIAGPLVNLCVALFLVGVWWLFPDVYPYTDLAVISSASLFIVNLIPAYPLDGGRLLLLILTEKMQRKKAERVVKFVGVIIAVMLLGLFVFSLFSTPNVTIILFVLFLVAGLFDGNKDNSYVRIRDVYSAKNLCKGKEIKSIGVSKDFTVKELYSILDKGQIYFVFVFDQSGKLIKVLSPDDVKNAIENKGLYEKII